MGKPKSPSKKAAVQPIPENRLLTRNELVRVSEELAAGLDFDGNLIGLLLVLLEHLQQQSGDRVMMLSSIGVIKDYLFVATTEAGDAQQQLQAEVRDKVLPFSRKVVRA